MSLFLTVNSWTMWFPSVKIHCHDLHLSIKRNNMDNEFYSLDVAVITWEHRKMYLQLSNDTMPTNLHDIEINPHGGLPVQVIVPTQYIYLGLFDNKIEMASFCMECLRHAAAKCGKRCPKCRQFISKSKLCTINTVLWNTIQLLFPSEVEISKDSTSSPSPCDKDVKHRFSQGGTSMRTRARNSSTSSSFITEGGTSSSYRTFIAPSSTPTNTQVHVAPTSPELFAVAVPRHTTSPTPPSRRLHRLLRQQEGKAPSAPPFAVQENRQPRPHQRRIPVR